MYNFGIESLEFGVEAVLEFVLVLREFVASGTTIALSLDFSRVTLFLFLVTVACIRFCACLSRMMYLLLSILFLFLARILLLPWSFDDVVSYELSHLCACPSRLGAATASAGILAEKRLHFPLKIKIEKTVRA